MESQGICAKSRARFGALLSCGSGSPALGASLLVCGTLVTLATIRFRHQLTGVAHQAGRFARDFPIKNLSSAVAGASSRAIQEHGWLKGVIAATTLSGVAGGLSLSLWRREPAPLKASTADLDDFVTTTIYTKADAENEATAAPMEERLVAIVRNLYVDRGQYRIILGKAIQALDQPDQEVKLLALRKAIFQFGVSELARFADEEPDLDGNDIGRLGGSKALERDFDLLLWSISQRGEVNRGVAVHNARKALEEKEKLIICELFERALFEVKIEERLEIRLEGEEPQHSGTQGSRSKIKILGGAAALMTLLVASIRWRGPLASFGERVTTFGVSTLWQHPYSMGAAASGLIAGGGLLYLCKGQEAGPLREAVAALNAFVAKGGGDLSDHEALKTHLGTIYQYKKGFEYMRRVEMWLASLRSSQQWRKLEVFQDALFGHASEKLSLMVEEDFALGLVGEERATATLQEEKRRFGARAAREALEADFLALIWALKQGDGDWKEAIKSTYQRFSKEHKAVMAETFQRALSEARVLIALQEDIKGKQITDKVYKIIGGAFPTNEAESAPEKIKEAVLVEDKKRWNRGNKHLLEARFLAFISDLRCNERNWSELQEEINARLEETGAEISLYTFRTACIEDEILATLGDHKSYKKLWMGAAAVAAMAGVFCAAIRYRTRLATSAASVIHSLRGHPKIALASAVSAFGGITAGATCLHRSDAKAKRALNELMTFASEATVYGEAEAKDGVKAEAAKKRLNDAIAVLLASKQSLNYLFQLGSSLEELQASQPLKFEILTCALHEVSLAELDRIEQEDFAIGIVIPEEEGDAKREALEAKVAETTKEEKSRLRNKEARKALQQRLACMIVCFAYSCQDSSQFDSWFTEQNDRFTAAGKVVSANLFKKALCELNIGS